MKDKNRNETQEIWEVIEGYKGIYMVSNRGRVKSLKRKVSYIKGGEKRSHTRREIILRNQTQNNGYLTVSLSKNSKTKTMYVHRLVARAFISNPKNKPQVNHVDGDKTNNCVNNLEWCTRDENEKHALLEGLKQKGEKHHSSRLTRNDVIQIRMMVELGWFSREELSISHGVTISCIDKIITRKNWKHV